MSRSSHVGHPAPGDPSTAEVVAAMVNDGSAAAVAATAVRLARQLGGRVRFVQILPATLEGDARAAAESAMFSTALGALRGRPQIQATFEAPTSDPAALLVARSRGALRLVLGEDEPHRGQPDSLAAHCIARAGCVVQVVPAEQPSGRWSLTEPGGWRESGEPQQYSHDRRAR